MKTAHQQKEIFAVWNRNGTCSAQHIVSEVTTLDNAIMRLKNELSGKYSNECMPAIFKQVGCNWIFVTDLK